MNDRERDSARHVVVAGGGIAGAEALLALRALAGARVRLTLIAPEDELVLPPLSVAEAFALGHAERHPLRALLREAGAEQVTSRLRSVDPARRSVELADGSRLDYDALVLSVGARPVARVEHATTWWPQGDREGVTGMLRDLEEGYTKRVAFVIPPGAVWPLPLYELALMTARQVSDMGIDDVELSVITPEAVPLGLFGLHAATVVRDELRAAGIRLHSATIARVTPGQPISIVLQPRTDRLEVDRLIALPGVVGPAIPGTRHDEAGFIEVGAGWRMRDSQDVWAAGDAVAYPVKFGGLAAQQADIIAADIAREVGAEPTVDDGPLTLQGVLMTGEAPRELTAATPVQAAHPMWRPTTKVFGEYLTPFLARLGAPRGADTHSGTRVDTRLPGPDADSGGFHALWRNDEADIDRLGHDMEEYRRRIEAAGSLLREHGELRSRG